MNADQSISFDICEENSECIYYLQNEMRKRNITQKDIENARRAEEMKILADVVKNAEMSGDVNVLDSDGATLVSSFFSVTGLTLLQATPCSSKWLCRSGSPSSWGSNKHKRSGP